MSRPAPGSWSGPTVATLHRLACCRLGCRWATGVGVPSESEIVAESDVEVIMIPGELYARAWLRPLRADMLAARLPGGGTVTMTTVERVVALHRVDLFADVPGRILAALAQRATEVEVGAGTVVIAEGRWRAHICGAGRLRVHHGERTITQLGPGSTVGELAALVPEPRSATVTSSRRRCCGSTGLFSRNCSLIDLRRGRIIGALVAMVRERARSETDTTLR